MTLHVGDVIGVPGPGEHRVAAAEPDQLGVQTQQRAAVLRPEAAGEDDGGALLRLHTELIRFRGRHPMFAGTRHTDDVANVQGHVLTLVRSSGADRAVVVCNTAPEPHDAVLPDPPALVDGSWELQLDSTEPEFGGSGSALQLPDADGRLTLGAYGFAVFEWAVAIHQEEE